MRVVSLKQRPRQALRRVPRVVLSVLEEASVDVARVARAAGLGPSELDGELDAARVDAFLLHALDASGDPGFGLKVGAEVRPELFSVVGFASMGSASYRVGLERLARYKRMCTGDHLELLPSARGAWARFYAAPAPARLVRAKVDAELAFLVAFGRRMTAAAVTPLRVRLRAAALDRAPYAAFFGCPLELGARHDEVLLSAADLARPFVSSRELEEVAERRAEALLHRATAAGTAVRVEEVLLAALGGVLPGFGDVARRLQTSPRSLQRHLRQERTSFVQLRNQARQTLARHYLAEEGLPIGDVAFLLGFGNASSFHRAFRRWTGLTPEAFRRRRA